MSSFGYTRQAVLGGSATSSTVTQGPVLVADWNAIALSVATAAAVASNHTLQASNDNGLQSSIVTWSNLSVIAAQGMVKVDSGVRWVRILRPSVDSTTVYTFAGRVG